MHPCGFGHEEETAMNISRPADAPLTTDKRRDPPLTGRLLQTGHSRATIVGGVHTDVAHDSASSM